MEIELTESRLEMANLPQRASIIPNPISGFPGFSINHCHFLPGSQIWLLNDGVGVG